MNFKKFIKDTYLIAWLKSIPDLKRQPMILIIMVGLAAIPLFFITLFGGAEMLDVGLVGVIVVLSSHRARARELKKRVAEGVYPAVEIRRLLALLSAGACLIVPGFATDALGILLLVPPVGLLVGWALESLFRPSLRELYEYLRIDH